MPGRGVGSPNNPYVFVEMGPDSISVNSISAHVVSTSEETNTSSTATGKSSSHMAPGVGFFHAIEHEHKI